MNTPDDLLNELLDEDALDPKKLFDEKEYNTLIIDRGGFSKKENNTADLLESLLEKNITRVESEEIFSKLKEMNAQKLLVDAIRNAERIEEKIILTATCWECGLDFSDDFIFFVELSCHENFQLAMEALTVVEYNDSELTKELLNDALDIAKNTKSKNTHLINDLVQNINSRFV